MSGPVGSHPFFQQTVLREHGVRVDKNAVRVERAQDAGKAFVFQLAP
jgi:hypothetical protein